MASWPIWLAESDATRSSTEMLMLTMVEDVEDDVAEVTGGGGRQGGEVVAACFI